MSPNGSSRSRLILLLATTLAVPAWGDPWTSAFTLAPKASQVLATKTIAPDVSGSITVASDARYGDLVGKTVALEPATGFSFDTLMVPRPR